MKIAIVSDPHIGNYGRKLDPITGKNSRLTDTVDALTWAIRNAQAQGCTMLFCLGDIAVSAKPNPTELCAIQSAFGDWTGEVYILEGNHDLPRNTAEVTSTHATFNRMKNVHVVSKRMPIDIDTIDGYVQTYWTPYPNKAKLASKMPNYASASPDDIDEWIGTQLAKEAKDALERMDTKHPRLLLGHWAVDMAKTGSEQSLMAGRDICVKLADIPAYDRVFLGHIHSAQDITDKIHIVGSTDKITYNEEDSEKSYIIYDTDLDTVTRVPIRCREWFTAEIDMTDGKTELTQDDYAKMRNAIVRVRVKRHSVQQPDFNAIRASVAAAGAYDFRGFVHDVVQVVQARDKSVMDIDTLPELLELWRNAKACPVALEALIASALVLEGGNV